MRWPAFLVAITVAMSANAQSVPAASAPAKLTLEAIAGDAPLSGASL